MYVEGKRPRAPLHAIPPGRGVAYSPRSRAAYKRAAAPGGLGFWPFGPSEEDVAARLLRWRQAVQTRGNAAVVMPSQGGSFAGQLAERIDASKVPAGQGYPSPAVRAGLYWYVPAPLELRQLYARQHANDQGAIATQALVERVQGLPAAVITAAGSTARTVVSSATGIPKWAIPVLLVAGAGYALYTALGGVRLLSPGRQDARD